MAALDGIFGPLAKDLISQFGASVTLKVTAQTFDPVTQTASVVSNSYALKGVIEDFKAYELQGAVMSGDAKVTIAALAVSSSGAQPPKPGDLINAVFPRLGAVDRTIVSIESLFSGDKVAAYVCQVR